MFWGIIFLYPLQPIRKINGNWYNCTNDVIVLSEFANPAFCKNINDRLFDNNIPVAIPIASSSLVAIRIFFFFNHCSMKCFKVESGTPIKFSIPLLDKKSNSCS